MASAVLLHPHPDLGGDQHNHVVVALDAALRAAGVTPHRFDFASADEQTARSQTVAAIEAADSPAFLVGYSFGGAVAASVAHASVAGWSLIAPALSMIAPVIGQDPRPKQLIAASGDNWFAPATVRAATADWLNTSHEVLAGADHFLAGGAAERAAALVVDWITAAAR
jgi:alpha/beta superfamily hydrolase